MKSILSILDFTPAYRLWMAPFAEQKLAPILEHMDLTRRRRILDVGCGPGTNAPHFRGHDYTGIDLNPRYVRDAEKRFSGRFVVADAREYTVRPEERYDLVLVNSLLHHLDDAGVAEALRRVASALTDDGEVHVAELLLPEHASVARLLARWDRGQHARTRGHWVALFSDTFEMGTCEMYEVRGMGVVLWNMLYLQGRLRGTSR